MKTKNLVGTTLTLDADNNVETIVRDADNVTVFDAKTDTNMLLIQLNATDEYFKIFHKGNLKHPAICAVRENYTEFLGAMEKDPIHFVAATFSTYNHVAIDAFRKLIGNYTLRAGFKGNQVEAPDPMVIQGLRLAAMTGAGDFYRKLADEDFTVEHFGNAEIINELGKRFIQLIYGDCIYTKADVDFTTLPLKHVTFYKTAETDRWINEQGIQSPLI